MKMILLFPGYGSQYVGMGKEFYDEFRVVQEYFEEASNCLNNNFVKLCFASSDVELARMTNAYPALFLISSAIVSLLKEQGIVPDEVCGYNQGEYAALFASGSISFPDGLYLLNKFAQFYEQMLEETNVAMIRVTDVAAEQVEEFCLQVNNLGQEKAFVAIYSTQTEVIVSGDAAAVDGVKERVYAQTSGVVDSVSSQIGLHSPLMNPLLEKFRIYLEKVDFKDPKVPVITPMNGLRLQSDVAIKELITKSINSPIVWNKVMRELKQYDLIVEVGPGTTLSSLVKKQYPDKQIMAINKKADLDALKALLQPQEEKVVELESVKQVLEEENKEE